MPAHTVLREAIAKRYIPAPHDAREVHARLAGFFRWSGEQVREQKRKRVRDAKALGSAASATGGEEIELSIGSKRRLEAELYHWRMAEQWGNVLGLCSDMEIFPQLVEPGDTGSLHCDLRRCVREADAHLDSYRALIDGLTRFEASQKHGANGRVAEVATEVAKFFGEMGRAVQAAEMYETLLAQPRDLLYASIASRHQVASVRVLYGNVLVQRWTESPAGSADKSFELVHRAQQQFSTALDELRCVCRQPELRASVPRWLTTKLIERLSDAREDRRTYGHSRVHDTHRELVVHDRGEVQDLERAKKDAIHEEEHAHALLEAKLVLSRADMTLAECLCLIGGLAYRSGDFEAAQAHYAEAAEYVEEHVGASHPLAAEAFLGLGNLGYQRGLYDEAERAIRKAMSIRQIAYGPSHPSFAEAVEALASLCEATGRDFDYQQLSKRAANIRAVYEAEKQELQRPAKRTLQIDSQHSAPVRSNLKDNQF